MPTRKDNTNVAPIYREQVFIPASGATLMKQKARPKFNGIPIAFGAIEIISPEFDLLTGVRGIYNIASTPINITSKNAIKITDKQWDKAYIKAVKNNDLNEAQRLRDLHFKAKAFDNVVTKDGMPVHNYHGTDTDFNIFDLSYFGKTDAGDRGRGFYFSSNKDIAESYGGIVKDVYLYGKTPYNGTRSSLLNRGRSKAEIITQYNKNLNKNINNDIKFLLEQQKSGDVSLLYKRLNIDKNTTPEQIKNKVIDYYSKKRDNFAKELGNIDEADIYLSDYENVIYDANKIKSAKSIIYDENGELINLSKRDNFNVNDIRMKCGGRRKARLGLDIREGGIAIPIAPNMYYMDGRSHDEGGIAIGPNNKNGLEVEGGEVIKVGKNDVKVFSSVPLLRGASPAELVLGGANPNKVFKAQEEFKDRNRINDDGTRYEIGGEKKIYEMPFAQRVQYARTGKITNTGYPVTPLQKGYSTLRALGRFRTAIKDRPWRLDEAFNSTIKGAMNDAAKTPVGWDKQYNNKGLQFIKAVYNRVVGNKGQNLGITKYETEDKQMKAGGIYIKPNKRGTFTAAATKHGMGVQEFASKVLANKEDYSPAMVKKANFARNASRWKKEYGGSMIYTINGNVKNGLMASRPKAKYGKIDRKDKDVKVGPDGLIYKRAADGKWYTDGTKHVTYKPINKSSREDLYYANPVKGLYHDAHDGNFANVSSIVPDEYEIITRKFDKPKRTHVSGYAFEDEEKETKKIGSLTYEKNESGKWVPSAKQSTTTTRDGGRPKDFGMTRTGVNHPSDNYKYHPLTGEKVNNDGIVETPEPSVKGATKVTSKSSSTPRGRGTKASMPKAAAKSTPTIQDTVNKVTMDAWKASKSPKIDLSKVEMPTYNVGDLGSKESKTYKANIPKSGRWIGQYKTTNVGDWIGLGSNLASGVASYFMTKNAINKMPEPIKPVMAQAVKLKTRYNVEPQLTELREAEQMNRAAVRRNTQSSNTSLAREQRLMNEARDARNTLYGQKENIETQLINKDRLNRQSVMRDNVRAYNEYLNRVTATKIAQNEMRASNINNLISGLTGSVSNILGTIESRRATNNTLRAIAAANPNVDARLIGGFDYYIDPITKKKYNKNQQYVGTING